MLAAAILHELLALSLSSDSLGQKLLWRAMFGFVAASGIVSEPQARASREDVIRHFNSAGAAMGTPLSSAQTALGSVTVFAISSNIE